MFGYVEYMQANVVICSCFVTYQNTTGPSPVSAFDQSDLETSPEPVAVPKRKTIIIKRSSKASQQWKVPRTKSSSQDSERLLKAVRETLEWYFR